MLLVLRTYEFRRLQKQKTARYLFIPGHEIVNRQSCVEVLQDLAVPVKLGMKCKPSEG